MSSHQEGLELSAQLSSVSNSVNKVSEKLTPKSGIIIPAGEMYIDPTLISNMTESHVTVQSSHPLLNTKKPDFVIIQPSSDICDKLGDPDFRKIQLDVQQCLETAQDMISDNPNTQVFITCLPPGKTQRRPACPLTSGTTFL